MMKSIELLAPAKDLECGIAAINCGADAVYIGAARFGAREKAGNSIEEIAALAQHAHTYWAKVYVTVNTLLHDPEIPQAVQLINQLHQVGVDGLIIQDAGLLECNLPPLPLIASTQMHNHSPEKVAFLEQVGFQRAILARELTLEEIKAIRKRTKIELECFIHGALCVCYSGQCYASFAIGGRSANRGQCAQPCRKAYSLEDGQGKVLLQNRHLLSLRDLNLTGSLRDLIDAGVSSFKIEGRLKDRAYIMNVVSHYRRQLDAVLEERDLRKSSSGRSVIDFAPNPEKTFNRGYTSHFLRGRGEKVGAVDTPKMVGEPVGTVASVARWSFTLHGAEPLHNGDGISFFDPQGELRGTTVNGVQGQTITPGDMTAITPGMRIFRNHDHEFLTQLAKSKPERLIGVSVTLRTTTRGFALVAVDEDNNRAECTLVCEKTPAQKPKMALEKMREQLGKMGGTAFTCTEVTLDLATVYFIPVTALNGLRRDVLEKLTAVRAASRPVQSRRAVVNLAPYPERALTFRGNVLNRLAANFYRRHGVAQIDRAAESRINLLGQQVMTTRYCLKEQLGLCPKTGAAATPEPLTLHDGEGNILALRFNCARCEMAVILQEKKKG